VSEDRAAKGDGSSAQRLTVFDLSGPTERRSGLRHLPRLTAGGLRLVWRASRRHFVFTMLAALGAAIAVAGQLLVARAVLKGLIAVSNGTQEASDLVPEFAWLVVVLVAMGSLAAILAHQQRLLNELVAQHAFDSIIDVSTQVDLASFEDPDFHDQLQRAKTSGTYRSMEMVNSINSLLAGLIVSIGISVVLLFLEPLLVLFIALASLPMLVATIHNSRESYVFEYAMTPENRERAYLIDLLTEEEPAKEVRVFDATPLLRRRYDALSDERLRKLREFLRSRLSVDVVGTVASAIGTGLALGSLIYLIANDYIDVATAVIAGFGMQQLSVRLTAVMGGFGKIIETGMFVDDYNAFLKLAPEVQAAQDRREARSKVPARRFEGLEVEDVSFTYPGTTRTALSDVSMRIGRGEVVALVGENGSGKTTLVKLICGLYRPTRGRILWSGQDAAALDPEELREDMTVIFQDFIQYHLSARDNIAMGRVTKQPDLDAVEAAARQSGADAFLSRLPEGYETRLGRQFYGGHELSVGQWQRVALARAFFRGGGFLVLDEPTAALDPRAEHDLFSQMRELAAGRSVLLVSHRFSSVRAADRIYVLDGGRIAEAGSHEELLAREGQYAELFNLQAAAYLGETPAS
jgi:ATP-binding cassette subfamily B protein